MRKASAPQIDTLKALITNARRVVFFGGAGVSTESGIPDFRSEDGVFKALSRYGRSPEELLSIGFFRREPHTFYTYYKELLASPNANPNAAHLALSKLEQQGKLTAVITQNIDGLHQLAGSKTVLELHGSMLRNYCMACGRRYTLRYVLDALGAAGAAGVPRCVCGGMIRPDIVMYGEQLDDAVIEAAVSHISAADLLIVGGTSLVVYPAAGLLRYFSGDNLVVINKSDTAVDEQAALCIHAPIGETLGACVA
ncbi:MAG: NAD-dependent protein deacylase [Clostridiales bacterium]|jgi:NAD-dependent deacetylase|nr:NAD-dependent protein deacylase [Clostridiales bacterium]